MGSWNGTCGVSQLSIMYGDDVAIFFMKKNKYREGDHTGYVYSDDVYKPVSPAIFGKYDDYGRVAHVVADDRIIRNLFKKKDNYDDIGELIDKESKNEDLYIMLVHLNLYRNILSKFKARKDFFTKGLSLGEFTKERLISFINDKKKGKLDYIAIGRKHWAVSESLDFQYRFYQNEKIYNDEVSKDSLVDNLADFAVFKHAMSTSRKLWIPQAGQGSQDQDYDMAKIIGEFAVEKEREDDEDW